MPKQNSMAIRLNTLGSQIRSIREQQGMTQETLAIRCTLEGQEMSRGTLAKVEAGLRYLTDDEFIALSKALKVHPGNLFSGIKGLSKFRP